MRRAIALVAVIILLGLAGIHSCQSEKKVQEAVSAVHSAEDQRNAADSTAKEALARLAAVKATVRIVRKVDTVLDRRIVEVRAAPVPDTCMAVVAVRDTLIDDMTRQRDSWRRAHDSSAAASSVLAVAYRQLGQSNDSLTRAVKLLMPRRKDFFSRLLHPEIRPSVFVGVCTDGRLCVGGGVALSF